MTTKQKNLVTALIDHVNEFYGDKLNYTAKKSRANDYRIEAAEVDYNNSISSLHQSEIITKIVEAIPGVRMYIHHNDGQLQYAII